MQYDIFISYSRNDNKNDQVSKLVDRIALEFEKYELGRAFLGRGMTPTYFSSSFLGSNCPISRLPVPRG
ncbi:MAG: hypothetical protein V2B20_25160 [Pseudomonadota bacterium]